MFRAGYPGVLVALLCGALAAMGPANDARADVFNLGDANLKNLEFVSVGDAGNAGRPPYRLRRGGVYLPDGGSTT